MLCAAAVWVAVKGVRAANSNVLVDDCIFSMFGFESSFVSCFLSRRLGSAYDASCRAAAIATLLSAPSSMGVALLLMVLHAS